MEPGVVVLDCSNTSDDTELSVYVTAAIGLVYSLLSLRGIRVFE